MAEIFCCSLELMKGEVLPWWLKRVHRIGIWLEFWRYKLPHTIAHFLREFQQRMHWGYGFLGFGSQQLNKSMPPGIWLWFLWNFKFHIGLACFRIRASKEVLKNSNGRTSINLLPHIFKYHNLSKKNKYLWLQNYQTTETIRGLQETH